jgi:hypothetical protein
MRRFIAEGYHGSIFHSRQEAAGASDHAWARNDDAAGDVVWRIAFRRRTLMNGRSDRHRRLRPSGGIDLIAHGHAPRSGVDTASARARRRAVTSGRAGGTPGAMRRLSLLLASIACTPVHPPDRLDEQKAALPAAWSVVTLSQAAPDLPWMRATAAFDGRLELPRSPVSEPMTGGPVVVIAKHGVFFAGRPVATIEDGEIVAQDLVEEHRIAALSDPLRAALDAQEAADTARGEAPWRMVTVYADGGAPFRVLVDTLYTGGRAGAIDYEFAVHPTGRAALLGSDVVRVSPPRFTTEPGGDEPFGALRKTQLVMQISRVDVRIGRHFPADPTRSAWLERIDLGDRAAALQKITDLARTTVAGEEWDKYERPILLFGAEQDVPLELMIAALAAAAGPDCDEEALFGGLRDRCFFTERVVHAGSAAPEPLAGK